MGTHADHPMGRHGKQPPFVTVCVLFLSLPLVSRVILQTFAMVVPYKFNVPTTDLPSCHLLFHLLFSIITSLQKSKQLQVLLESFGLVGSQLQLTTNQRFMPPVDRPWLRWVSRLAAARFAWFASACSPIWGALRAGRRQLPMSIGIVQPIRTGHQRWLDSSSTSDPSLNQLVLVGGPTERRVTTQSCDGALYL